jgi:hypothetical protein
MTNHNLITKLVWLLLVLLPAIAHGQEDLGNLKPGLGFLKNEGQIVDQHGLPDADVNYLLTLPGNNITLRSTGFSYNTYVAKPARGTADEAESVQYDFHRVDVEFLNARKDVVIQPEDELPGDVHYSFGEGDAVISAGRYKKVVYHNVYPGIDIEFVASSHDQQKPFEYNFIVHPGADVSDIKLEYSGAGENLLQESSLTLTLRHASLVETIPASYWRNTGEAVAVTYRKVEETDRAITIGFTGAGLERQNQALVIDPTPHLEWATYYGGADYDSFLDIAVDATGNIIVGGWTRSANFLTTTGAYQTEFTGGRYGTLLKLNANKQLLWATYYSIKDQGYNHCSIYAMTTDQQGNIYATGNLSVDVETVNTDVFVTKFNPSGIPVWRTIFTGTGNDVVVDIVSDEVSAVYIGGFTSSANYGSTDGAYQYTKSSSYDAFIKKISFSGEILWATYYGGNGAEEFDGVAVDGDGNLYITGITGSTNLITGGSPYQAISRGQSDVFLAKFSPSGALLWHTYYGGAGDEAGGGVETDGAGNVYLIGGTESDDYIDTDGAYQSERAGGRDSFIAKFTSAGNRLWATYFGGSEADHAFATACDETGNVYISGYTHSPGRYATPDTYQGAIKGDADAYLSKFNSGGSLVWSTYYGGDGLDVTDGIALDASGNVYLAGNTFSANLPVTANAIQSSPGGGASDGFIAKFLPTTSCEIILPNPQWSISASSVYIKGSVTLTAANHQAGNQYEFRYRYYQGSNHFDDVVLRSSGQVSYVFADKPGGYLAVGHHIIEITSTKGACSLKASFPLEVEDVQPLCETMFVVGTSRNVRLDRFSGAYVFKHEEDCVEDIRLACVGGETDLEQFKNVVSASATTFSDDWDYSYTRKASSGNKSDNANVGKWRAKGSYVYKNESVSVRQNYNSGTFSLPVFDWRGPSSVEKKGWLKMNEVDYYSRHGEAVQSRDALNIISVTKLGYTNTLPYLVATNASYNSVFFESFENYYGTSQLFLEDGTPLKGGTLSGASTHAGLRSFLLTGDFETRSFTLDHQIRTQGMIVRLWAKGNDLAASFKLGVRVQGDVRLLDEPFINVATSGEWSLWQFRVTPQALSLPAGTSLFEFIIRKQGAQEIRLDDIRIQPTDAEMACYVYDPRTLKVLATLDGQHFGTFYQYNMEGKLVRKELETTRGKKTLQETHYNIPEVPKTTTN